MTLVFTAASIVSLEKSVLPKPQGNGLQNKGWLIGRLELWKSCPLKMRGDSPEKYRYLIMVQILLVIKVPIPQQVRWTYAKAQHLPSPKLFFLELSTQTPPRFQANSDVLLLNTCHCIIYAIFSAHNVTRCQSMFVCTAL
jgi:hypothetical protein